MELEPRPTNLNWNKLPPLQPGKAETSSKWGHSQWRHHSKYKKSNSTFQPFVCSFFDCDAASASKLRTGARHSPAWPTNLIPACTLESQHCCAALFCILGANYEELRVSYFFINSARAKFYARNALGNSKCSFKTQNFDAYHVWFTHHLKVVTTASTTAIIDLQTSNTNIIDVITLSFSHQLKINNTYNS